MEEIGVVKSIEGVYARVAVKKKSMCEHCTAGTCHLTEEGAEIEALNEARAQVGNRVRVVLRAYSYLKGSLILYGLPALALIVGAVAGKEYFSRFFRGMDPDSVAALFAFGLFALSFIVIRLWSARAERKTQYKPVIEEILGEENQL